jgi:hypothetical protein
MSYTGGYATQTLLGKQPFNQQGAIAKLFFAQAASYNLFTAPFQHQHPGIALSIDRG